MYNEDKRHKKLKNVINIDTEGMYSKSFGVKSMETSMVKSMYKKLFK